MANSYSLSSDQRTRYSAVIRLISSDLRDKRKNNLSGAQKSEEKGPVLHSLHPERQDADHRQVPGSPVSLSEPVLRLCPHGTQLREGVELNLLSLANFHQPATLTVLSSPQPSPPDFYILPWLINQLDLFTTRNSRPHSKHF